MSKVTYGTFENKNDCQRGDRGAPLKLRHHLGWQGEIGPVDFAALLQDGAQVLFPGARQGSDLALRDVPAPAVLASAAGCNSFL